jgi:hypothetical protein
MPRSFHAGEQWKRCDRCGILTPYSQLLLDKGTLLCDRYGCRDRVDDEVHKKYVAKVLSQPSEEGTDRSAQLYFAPEDWDGHDI